MNRTFWRAVHDDLSPFSAAGNAGSFAVVTENADALA
jgi:hypothetical protein